MGWTATSLRCGEDECLQTLVLIVSAVTWCLAAATLVARLVYRGGGLAAWILTVAWIPVAWLVSTMLFAYFPSLGGA
jgi:hypothetical protein